MTVENLREHLPQAFSTTSTFSAKGGYIAEPVEIQGLSLDFLDLNDVDINGHFVLNHCRLGLVKLTKLRLGGDLIIQDCKIDQLEVRRLVGAGSVAIFNVQADRLLVYGVNSLTIGSSSFNSNITASEIAGICRLTDLNAGVLEIIDCAGSELDIFAERLICPGYVRIQSIEGTQVHLEEITAGELEVRRCAFTASPGLRVSGAAIRGNVQMQAVSGAEVVFDMAESTVGGSITLLELESDAGGCVGRLSDVHVMGNASVRDRRGSKEASLLLVDSSIRGELMLSRAWSNEAEGTTLHLVGSPTVQNLLLPPTPPIRWRDATLRTRRIFGAAGELELATLKSSLAKQGRYLEEDRVYYALQAMRHQEMSGLPARVRHLVGAYVLGWGVRLSAPLLTLAAFVCLTAAVLSIYTSGWKGLLGLALLESLAVSAQIWLSIEPGITSRPADIGFDLIAAAVSLAGLLLLTLAVGIVIRRLVR